MKVKKRYARGGELGWSGSAGKNVEVNLDADAQDWEEVS